MPFRAIHGAEIAFVIVVILLVVVNFLFKDINEISATSLANRANWMSKYPNKTLLDLYIPASHNSGCYQTVIKPVMNVLSLVAAIFNKFTITQDVNIYNQLIAGVRLLDIRVNTELDQPYVSHTALCLSLQDCFEQIKQFINEHPSEVVIILLKKDTNFETIDWNEIAAMIDSYFVDIAVPAYGATYSIGTMVNNKRQVVIINENNADIKSNTPLWPRELVSNKWYNTSDPTVFTNNLQTDNNAIDRKRMNISDVIITPNTDSIIQSLNPFGKKPRSLKSMNIDLLNMLVADMFPHPMVCMMDFVDNARISFLIDLNNTK